MFRLLANRPVESTTIQLTGTPITTAAWATLIASLKYGASALELFNPSGSTIQLAQGAAGFEVPLPYTVLPGGMAILPLEFKAGSRISAKAVDQDATGPGQFTLNFFG
jgi:hypothetical protein